MTTHTSSLLKEIRRRLIATQFRPSLFGMLTNPFYFARSNLHKNLATISGEVGGRMLDVGCGQKPYRHLFHVTEHVGLEIDSPANRENKQADFFYDGHTFPFPDESFDTVFASQVFEHVFNPDEFLGEARRVLRRGGVLLLTLPFVWDEHEQPYDFARYSSFGLTHVLQNRGFRVQEIVKSGDDLSVVLQTVGMYVYKALAPGTGLFKAASAGLMTIPLNTLGSLLVPLMPKNPDLFLDLLVLAVKVDAPSA
jgi:SAM-dependent methyltransferase